MSDTVWGAVHGGIYLAGAAIFFALGVIYNDGPPMLGAAAFALLAGFCFGVAVERHSHEANTDPSAKAGGG